MHDQFLAGATRTGLMVGALDTRSSGQGFEPWTGVIVLCSWARLVYKWKLMEEVAYVGPDWQAHSGRKKRYSCDTRRSELWRFGTIWPNADVTFLPIP